MSSTNAGIPCLMRRATLYVTMVFAGVTALWLLASRFMSFESEIIPGSSKEIVEEHGTSSASSELADLALQKVLNDASPIFGHYATGNTRDTATWMKLYPDKTPIVRMNIPGTHDAATWNYSSQNKEVLDPITDLVKPNHDPSDFYRCQDKSLFDMLNDGIRAFDLRYAYDVTNSTLVFWHGPGLQSETATVEDVLFGFYQWLDDHPSEALFLSYQHEHHTESAYEQLLLYDALTSPAAKKYISQTKGTLGTLGSVRGKITLLRRFTLTELGSSYDETLPGLHFPPTEWTVNGADIALQYNKDTGETAYIEDYYTPQLPKTTRPEVNIRWKYNATTAALERAASRDHSGSLYWSFASSTNTDGEPPKTPRTQALGSGRDKTPEGGVNNQLVEFLKGMKGQRLGIVMFDFYEQPAELMDVFLGLQTPGDTL